MSKEDKKVKDSVETANEVLLSDGVSVVVEGVEYKLRRLGINDVFTLWDIIKEVYAMGNTEVAYRMQNILGDEGASIATTLLMGLSWAREPLTKFYADMLRVPLEDLENPDIFPVESLLIITDALTQHPDFKAFLARLQKSGESLLQTANQLGKTPTTENTDT